MGRLKIGFIPIEGGHYYREALEEVCRAEELGFDSAWMEEHHSVTNHYWPSPLTVLAGFATRTTRLSLGTDILVSAFYHPVRLAEDVALLDVMSQGRFTLGSRTFNVANGGLDLSFSGGHLEDVRSAVDAARADIVSGRIVVPHRPAERKTLTETSGWFL